MSSYLEQLFDDKNIIARVKDRMPKMFQLAELESSRAGKIGMEVGTARERIIAALLMYKYGEENVGSDLPITESEADVSLFSEKISIKTITGNLSGVKLAWTVDKQKAREFFDKYYPDIDMLLTQIIWGSTGGFIYIPKIVQQDVYKKLGKNKYFKLPKAKTNPRGVELTKRALELMVNDKRSNKIDILWTRGELSYNAYDRWIELWKE
ncbi:MAG: hypothetical protein UX60_C0011G0026 [Berkelbacteria bacterium GW2011_GWA2_46_7]|uniref:Type II restriction endonuclease subunit R n=1 Tax=Berkelbacteria bacterium GW2011_GWA2_46_7 TaxID=1618335 RepID=A0A0G1QGL1_9BACT|nr:MAG: hypothetical protein UX60_C0011G0026 [Berkelbacteria bacterium GW2011_GWA2_46_7]